LFVATHPHVEDGVTRLFRPSHPFAFESVWVAFHHGFSIAFRFLIRDQWERYLGPDYLSRCAKIVVVA
jgi:hypothetical protein